MIPKKKKIKIKKKALSALPHRWSWEDIFLWRWSIEINQDSRVIRLIGSRERNQRTWTSISTSTDVNLATGEIELSTANIARIMESNVLCPNKILPIRKAGW